MSWIPVLLLAFPSTGATPPAPSRVEAAVLASLESAPGGRASVVIALAPAAIAPGADRRAAIEEAQELLLADLAGTGFELAYRYRTFPALAGRAGTEALDALGRHPLVKSVGPSARIEAMLAESVPHIRADQVQALGYTGQGMTVAVIDTGIDTNHPDLADDLAPGAWHFLGDGTDTGPGAEDDNGHGTHVSGIITSAGNVAPPGVAPDAEILAVKMLSASGGGTLIDLLAAIDYITASVPNYASLCAINMSLATVVTYSTCPCDDVDTLTTTVQDALEAAQDAGLAVFSASGNNGSCSSMGAPACVSAATAVAATQDTNDDIAGFSNRNACNALAAPGESITSSYIGGGDLTQGGTSMATPHVAATAALVQQRALSVCRVLSPAELVQILSDTAVPTNDPCATSPNPRRVDALSAVLAVEGDAAQPYCFGDGSGTPCPCGNEETSALCRGCAHSGAEGAAARSRGSASASADDLEVDLDHGRPGQPALLFAGLNAVAGGNGAGFGDGLRCAGGGVQRLGVVTQDGSGAATYGPGLGALAGWSAGDDRYLQVWYRDPTGSPCGSGFNLSNGLELVVEP